MPIRSSISERFSIGLKAIALFVQCALGVFIAVVPMSMHLHELPDGRMIVHSHAVPESDSGGNHTHSDQDYQVIGAIGNSIHRVTVACVVVFEVPKCTPQRYAGSESAGYIEREVSVQSGRSPPSLLVIS
jgi:hypothetical protein